MTTKVQKWGNSQGIRLSKAALEGARIQVGEEVKVIVQPGRIVIEPVLRVRGRHDLKELVSRMPRRYVAKEEDWGAPTGRETW